MSATIGNTYYKFPVKKLGKRPELSASTKIKRKIKTITARVLRYWQDKAFNKLYRSKFFLVKAFCGSGKTTLTVAMCIYDILKNRRKQIIIVPQSHIGDGFAVSGKFDIPGVGIVNLCAANNFCENSPSKVDMIINFLLTPAKFSKFDLDGEFVVDGSEGIVVCTHQAFNTAMKKIIADGNFDLACKNASFYIDEAHHIKGGESSKKKEDELEKDYNHLGKTLYQIINNADKNNSRIGLTTATFFRGDQGIIVKKQYLEKFDRYELDFLSHFETLEIEDVFVNFEEYSDNPTDQIIENIRKEIHTERHLVVVPTIKGKWRAAHDPFLNRFIIKLSKMLKEEGFDPEESMLDLVPEVTQDKRKAVLLKEPKERYSEENNSKIRVVITCMLGREGTDWCPCSRLHNASIELGSPTLAVQTLGRLFRKFEGKTKVGVIYYIKKFHELLKSISKRDFFTDRINAMLSLMIIDDFMNPIMLPEIPIKGSSINKRGSKNSKKNKGIKLADVFGDNFEQVKKNLIEAVSLESSFDEETVDQIIDSVIAKYNFKNVVQIKTNQGKKFVEKESIIAGLKIFLLKARSQALRQKSINVSEIRKNGFDLLAENNGLNGNFWCGNLGKKEFVKFKELISKICWSESQKMEIANNIRKHLPARLGFKIDERKKEHEKIIKKTLSDLSKFHKIYKEVAEANFASTPSKQDVIDKSKMSTFELNSKVNFFNKLLPSGYSFFTKGSRIVEKLGLEL